MVQNCGFSQELVIVGLITFSSLRFTFYDSFLSPSRFSWMPCQGIQLQILRTFLLLSFFFHSFFLKVDNLFPYSAFEDALLEEENAFVRKLDGKWKKAESIT